MYPAIAGDGNAERFRLLLEPDGVYRVDGRAIPSRDDPAACIDHGEPIVGIHSRCNNSIGLIGVVLGVHVEQ